MFFRHFFYFLGTFLFFWALFYFFGHFFIFLDTFFYDRYSKKNGHTIASARTELNMSSEEELDLEEYLILLRFRLIKSNNINSAELVALKTCLFSERASRSKDPFASFQTLTADGQDKNACLHLLRSEPSCEMFYKYKTMSDEEILLYGLQLEMSLFMRANRDHEIKETDNYFQHFQIQND